MKATIIQLARIFILSAVAALIAFGFRDAPTVPVAFSCDRDKLSEDQICLADIPENALLVDARLRSEWEVAHFRNAILWNIDPTENQQDFEAAAVMQIASAELVVVYCGSKACGTSKEVAKRIRQLGLPVTVKTLYGGWDAIKDSSDPL